MQIERDSFSDPWSRASFEAALDLERMRFLVAVGGEQSGERGVRAPASRVVGYVIALLLVDEAEIADIAVVPASRGRGIGGQLLDRMCEDAAELGVRSLYLEVRESNAAARALYASRFFKPVGRRPGYYRQPLEDALVLRKDIKAMVK